MRFLNIIFAAAFISTAAPALAEKPPTTWDGLLEVKSKKIELVYLLPHADFRPYTKIQYDPVQIALQKDWLRNYNQSEGLGGRISDTEVRKAITKASGEFDKYFAQGFTNAGYTIVTAPGPDVLHVSVGVANVTVTAPDTGMSAGMSFAANAGQATLIVEARDSLTNQLLGRAIDQQLAGDEGVAIARTSASNWGDFEDLFKTWAKASTNGLTELKSLSPIDAAGMQKH